MTNRIDATATESLRTFAAAHGEIQFVHLCSAALAGEEWAVDRVEPALREFFFAPCHEDRVVEFMQNTDTTRPDGAIVRSVEV